MNYRVEAMLELLHVRCRALFPVTAAVFLPILFACGTDEGASTRGAGGGTSETPAGAPESRPGGADSDTSALDAPSRPDSPRATLEAPAAGSTPPFLPPPESEGDRIIYEFIEGFSEMSTLLDTIENEETATEVGPRVTAIAETLRELIPGGEALPDEERARTNARYSDRLQYETRRFTNSLQRAAGVPGAAEHLVDVVGRMSEISASQSGDAAADSVGSRSRE